jgi:hypothetical protein
MKNLILQILLYSGLCFYANSQLSIDASGGHGQSSNYSFSYSLGEVTTATLKTTGGLNYFATSGVIQPDPLLIIDVKDTYLDNQILYPNPVNNTLFFFPGFSGSVNAVIYKYDGKFIKAEKLNTGSINVSEFTSGLYYIILSNTKSNSSKIYQFVKL